MVDLPAFGSTKRHPQVYYGAPRSYSKSGSHEPLPLPGSICRGSVVLRHSPVPRQSTRDQWIDLECDSTVSPLSHDPKDR
jgi:hypothetical protein